MGALKSLGGQGPAPKAPNALARARRRSVRGGASCVPAPDPRSPAPVPALPVPGAPPPQGPAARRAQRRQRAAGARSRERGARRCGARAGARAGRSRLGQLKRCRGGGPGPGRAQDGAAAAPGAPGPSSEGITALWGRLAGEDQGEGGLAEGVCGRRINPTSPEPGRLCPSQGGCARLRHGGCVSFWADTQPSRPQGTPLPWGPRP